jgi:HTH-type transcriptional regulator / antitoxin HigA
MLDLPTITQVWNRNATVLNQVVRPKTEAQYLELIALIEYITDTVADLEDNPYSALLEIAITYADEWEAAVPDLDALTAGRDTLEFLMEQHGLSQKDLERAGIASQPVISKILSGERAISKATAKRLAAHFRVESSAFL